MSNTQDFPDKKYAELMESYSWAQLGNDLFNPPLIDFFLCPICKCVLHEPLNLDCGHVLCKGCFEGSIHRNQIAITNYSCEICACVTNIPKGVNSVIRSIDIWISKSSIQCPAPNCSHIIPMLGTHDYPRRFLYEHLEVCGKVPVRCPYCIVEVLRENLDNHIQRECNYRECLYCHDYIERHKMHNHCRTETISENVIRYCKRTMICPNKLLGCSAVFLKGKQSQNEHLTVCQKQTIACTVCKENIPWDHLDAHCVEKRQLHDSLFIETERKLVELQRSISTGGNVEETNHSGATSTLNNTRKRKR